MANKTSQDLVAYFDSINAKLPVLPADFKRVLVQITPIIAIVFGVIGLLVSLAGLGILTALSPFAMMAGAHVGIGIVSVLIGFVSSVLLIVAFPGLQKKQYKGWNFLFWSQLLSVVASVISLSIVGVVVALIGLYLIFQIKQSYK